MSLETDDPAPFAAAAGSEEVLTAASKNIHENTLSRSAAQAVSTELLAIKRGGIWNVGATATIHLDLALGCLQVADDDGLMHHVERAVIAMRSVAKLTNDLSATRNESPA